MKTSGVCCAAKAVPEVHGDEFFLRARYVVDFAVAKFSCQFSPVKIVFNFVTNASPWGQSRVKSVARRDPLVI